MKKEELIKKLQELPDDIDVNLFDYRMNLHDDHGDGSHKGIYSEFDIEVIKLDEEDRKYLEDLRDTKLVPWAAISFSNDDYEDQPLTPDHNILKQ